jgi:tetratricopeptide (TPR) repeat protein
MKNLAPEKQLEILNQEVNVTISLQMADLGQNHEAVKTLDKICTKTV